MQWYRSAGGENAVEAREMGLMLFAVTTDSVPHGGGTVGLGSLPRVKCFEDIFWLYKRGLRWVHIRDDCGDLHSEVEECEEGEARDINFTGLDIVVIADEIDLCIEHLVFVDDAFWWPGAAAGKDDGGGIGGQCDGEGRSELSACFDELFVGDAAEVEEFGSDDDI